MLTHNFRNFCENNGQILAVNFIIIIYGEKFNGVGPRCSCYHQTSVYTVTTFVESAS